MELKSDRLKIKILKKMIIDKIHRGWRTFAVISIPEMVKLLEITDEEINGPDNSQSCSQ